jgi:hypothetical protein
MERHRNSREYNQNVELCPKRRGGGGKTKDRAGLQHATSTRPARSTKTNIIMESLVLLTQIATLSIRRHSLRSRRHFRGGRRSLRLCPTAPSHAGTRIRLIVRCPWPSGRVATSALCGPLHAINRPKDRRSAAKTKSKHHESKTAKNVFSNRSDKSMTCQASNNYLSVKPSNSFWGCYLFLFILLSSKTAISQTYLTEPSTFSMGTSVSYSRSIIAPSLDIYFSNKSVLSIGHAIMPANSPITTNYSLQLEMASQIDNELYDSSWQSSKLFNLSFAYIGSSSTNIPALSLNLGLSRVGQSSSVRMAPAGYLGCEVLLVEADAFFAPTIHFILPISFTIANGHSNILAAISTSIILPAGKYIQGDGSISISLGIAFSIYKRDLEDTTLD